MKEIPSNNNADEKSSRPKKKKPKKITAHYLHNAGLFYLQRFTASRSHFYDVMMQKIKKSCAYHKDQDIEACKILLNELIKKFEDLEFLNDDAYAKAYITSLRLKGFSAKKIMYQCKNKGLDSSLSSTMLETVDCSLYGEKEEDTDLLAATRYAKKKRIGPYRKKEQTPELIRKELSSLARAGFSYDIAKRIVNTNMDEESEHLLG